MWNQPVAACPAADTAMMPSNQRHQAPRRRLPPQNPASVPHWPRWAASAQSPRPRQQWRLHRTAITRHHLRRLVVLAVGEPRHLAADPRRNPRAATARADPLMPGRSAIVWTTATSARGGIRGAGPYLTARSTDRRGRPPNQVRRRPDLGVEGQITAMFQPRGEKTSMKRKRAPHHRRPPGPPPAAAG